MTYRERISKHVANKLAKHLYIGADTTIDELGLCGPMTKEHKWSFATYILANYSVSGHLAITLHAYKRKYNFPKTHRLQ